MENELYEDVVNEEMDTEVIETEDEPKGFDLISGLIGAGVVLLGVGAGKAVKAVANSKFGTNVRAKVKGVFAKKPKKLELMDKSEAVDAEETEENAEE